MPLVGTTTRTQFNVSVVISTHKRAVLLQLPSADRMVRPSSQKYMADPIPSGIGAQLSMLGALLVPFESCHAFR